MAYSQKPYNDIQNDLMNELEAARQQFPELKSKLIYVLNAISDDNDELKQILEQEKNSHNGKRIILSPCFVKSLYWVGILIEFENDNEILRADYINPVDGHSYIPHKLKEQFKNVYSSGNFHIRDLEKDDEKLSAKLTIRNLIRAAQTEQHSHMLIQDVHQSSYTTSDEKIMPTISTSTAKQDHSENIDDLEEELNKNLRRLQLTDRKKIAQRIQHTKRLIKHYEYEKKPSDIIQKEKERLNQLQRVQYLIDKISNMSNATTNSNDDQHSTNRSSNQVCESSNNISAQEKTKNKLDLDNLHDDWIKMPYCAEKIVMELLEYFERELLEEKKSVQDINRVSEILRKLDEQIKEQDLSSEKIETSLQDLRSIVHSGCCRDIIYALRMLLKNIRPLNLQEIKRLVSKATEAASVVREKDIILLVGYTGSGKSTTMHFLAGSKMQKIKVEVDHGRYLHHITPVEPIENPGLKNVICSPFSKSETRYIAPVTIPLSKVLDPDETGVITLCDAPGFADTSGPEVDIANCIGIVEALKVANSVKILALSSLQGLGDKGEGIQKLAHTLSDMIAGIEDRLDHIIYGFTKFPDDFGINGLLRDIKRQTVNNNPILQSDTSFVKVLTHMIEETDEIVYIINPINGDRKRLIRKLRKGQGIKNPEVFRFSMSEKTRSIISDHATRDRFNIISAVKHKNNELMMFYLNDLMLLENLVKQSYVRDAYKDSKRFIGENLNEYIKEVIKKFNDAFESRDGLNENDIEEYKSAIEYLEQMQILKEHLQSDLLSPESLKQNIIIKTQERNQELNKEDSDLDNPLVEVHLNNLLLIKNYFQGLDHYTDSCKKFKERFGLLEESAKKLISPEDFKYDFNEIAKIFFQILKCSNSLKHHLGKDVENAYENIVKSFLKKLNNLCGTSNTILQKLRLKDEDIEILKRDINILRLAKECSPLQDRIFTYKNLLKNKPSLHYESDLDIDDFIIDLNGIHKKYINQIVEYFERINQKIEGLFKTSKEHALEDTEQLVADMNALRSIPEIEVKTAGKYYRTIDEIRSYMRESQIDTEQILFSIDHQTGMINYRNLSQSLSRLKQAKWINNVSPGAHDTLMRRIKEKIELYINELEYDLKKKDYSLRNPDQITVAKDIIEKLESMRDLERSIPEIKECINKVLQQFSQRTQAVFDRIQKTFNLQDQKICQTVVQERNKQSYNFSDTLDSSTAEKALIYLSKCEEIPQDSIRKTAVDIHEILQNFLQEYGEFLNKKIKENFEKLCDVKTEKSPFQYSPDLEMDLQELSSIGRFPHVSEYINRTEKVQHWRYQFRRYYVELHDNIQKCTTKGETNELGKYLTIAEALISVDDFCKIETNTVSFETLYKQYHEEIIKNYNVKYATILEYISKYDYSNVDWELLKISDSSINQTHSNQIKFDLSNSLNRLMKTTKSITNSVNKKIERLDEKIDEITQIKENIEKIETARTKKNIVDRLDDTIINSLQNFKDHIYGSLFKAILKGLNFIETLIDSYNLYEADEALLNIDKIQSELNDSCSTPDISENSEETVSGKSAKLRERLSKIVGEIFIAYDFKDIKNYPKNPPKDLLSKLKSASENNMKFKSVHGLVEKKLKEDFHSVIKTAGSAPFHERSEKITSLNSALYFLPEALKDVFRQEINELSQKITDEEIKQKQMLDEWFSNDDEDEHIIIEIGKQAKEYKEKHMGDLLQAFRGLCLKKLSRHRTSMQDFLSKEDVRSALHILMKMFKYEESIGEFVPKAKSICKSVRELINEKFSIYCRTLSEISAIEQTEMVVKAFNNIIICLEFFNPLEKRIQDLVLGDLENLRSAFDIIFQYLYGNCKIFEPVVEEINIDEQCKVLSLSKRWNKFLIQISRYKSQHQLAQEFSKKMKDIISYETMIKNLNKFITELRKKLDVEIINDNTVEFERDRDDLFIGLMKIIHTIKRLDSKFKDILSSISNVESFEREFLITLNIEKLEEGLKKQIENIGEQLICTASKPKLSISDSGEFRKYYYHLVSCSKFMTISELNVKKDLKKAEEKIFEKVKSLRKEVFTSGSDAVKVAESLVEMKFFAVNLIMFDSTINDEIDETLKIYREKQGAAVIMSLITELKKTELGSQIIGAYDTLKMEDWGTLRHKMQNQDNLGYVLKNLTGDDLAKDALELRYTKFRKAYESLISTHLKTLKPNSSEEPDLEVLVTETKRLVGMFKKPSSKLWSASFTDEIPNILAHIFALWTLKNTQYYNAMLEIRDNRTYLLMPHVGQVIAIFRLLGISYDSHARFLGYNIPLTGKISDDLINNLVEIGTGEGKSVVLAVTACVFALVGIDVNCSCYSEVLSRRDKNDFTSVFRALGIEENIEYGTFNKLCEQFLNEQCNVRDKVLDMIVNNQNTLTVTDTSVHLRLKVLLIDEVDVFLSDKYYGGMYTPAVYLRDPSIKVLLDAIWKNKTLRTLNNVKSLPAYQTCKTKYSNWIFLFDEAIKDMLAALQSYKSSTYIVENDKIVYVEGDSIADNIVRGYDTVWAYYHENELGHISERSLDTNVGIIIHCGTFSYAEMPHDFAYISGVTGTLKTLAKTENEILKDVYNVEKKTYIPSVFESDNRTYNSKTDVRVVKRSEYFMAIYEEIQLTCNAGRAILVFFESEEKLMAFYNSSQLSTIKRDVQIVIEKVAPKERDRRIKQATTLGKVTLLTRKFGRGTDFICRSQQVLLNGGIHVLQTFFSEELSEEYQIMGRGARQGDKGSYGMILLDEDLEWVLGSSWEEKIPKIKGTIYQVLNNARNALYESKCGAKKLGIDQCKRQHKASKDFMNALCKGNIEAVREFLSEENRGANLRTTSRTVLLMDATGSMSSLLIAAKETVCTMFERASIILKEKGFPDDNFQMQFVVYRDYDCKKDGILQSSSWESKPINLRNFMAEVKAFGGGDYEEAIEIGLWHAFEESEKSETERISQVIIIGDAPAKDMQAIKNDREIHGGEKYWKKTKYNTPIHYTEPLQKLKEKKIPIHAFYLHNDAKDNFTKIANETSGRCEKLDINSPQGAELLTDFVTEEVLRKIDVNQGDELVELYRKKYVKAFLSPTNDGEMKTSK